MSQVTVRMDNPIPVTAYGGIPEMTYNSPLIDKVARDPIMALHPGVILRNVHCARTRFVIEKNDGVDIVVVVQLRTWNDNRSRRRPETRIYTIEELIPFINKGIIYEER